ncbi:MAG: hypothetical protein ACR2N6_09415 [Miltoncostaeaceae bacterium]
MIRPIIVVVVVAALAVVIALAVAFASQTTTDAADLPTCGPSERLPCIVERDGTTLVVAVNAAGERAFVPPEVFDERLAELVNEHPRPCFTGADAC